MMNDIIVAILIASAILCILGAARRRFYGTKLEKLQNYLQKFESYFSSESVSSGSYNWELARSQTEIKKLFIEAGITPGHVLHMESKPNVGIASAPMSAWDNITLLDREVIEVNRMSFHRAIGYFETRRDETFTLVYAIEFLLFHPRKLIGLVGGNEKGPLGIVANIGLILAEIIAIYELIIKSFSC